MRNAGHEKAEAAGAGLRKRGGNKCVPSWLAVYFTVIGMVISPVLP